MTEPVNLRLARKAKARAEKEQQAEENRLLFGQTKAQKELRAAVKERIIRTMDQGKLEPLKKPGEP
jgi:Domain of unknown function (DUF4169)